MNRITVCVLLMLAMLSACGQEEPAADQLDFQGEMRSFVMAISRYAKAAQPGFIIVPQNGAELLTDSDDSDAAPHAAYLQAIDGQGQEDLFYGYEEDDAATPAADNAYLRSLLDVARQAGKGILVTDYCSTPGKMEDAYARNKAQGYISFAADHRELDHVPAYPAAIHQENTHNIASLADVQNFLYLIDPGQFGSKAAFIQQLSTTNYDLLIMDAFFHDGMAFSQAEIGQLKKKANGGSRLVIAYMSIGEAENYRYYWNRQWSSTPPAWLDRENPAWEGNYKVRYWQPEWQQVIFGNDNSYLNKILDARFDGVYLDIIDAFEYFEEQ